jgi:hypothetical protein
MSFYRLVWTILLALGCAAAQTVQTPEPPMPHLTPGAARKPEPETNGPVPKPVPQTIELTVPKGTPLQVALDEEVRVQKVGQPIHGKTVEPVYTFDHVVVPIGSEVKGEMTKIETLSNGRRTIAALDGDFTPTRKVEVTFNELILADGRHYPIHTVVAPGSGR